MRRRGVRGFLLPCYLVLVRRSELMHDIGLYNHNWSGWRSASNIAEMKKAAQLTLA